MESCTVIVFNFTSNIPNIYDIATLLGKCSKVNNFISYSSVTITRAKLNPESSEPREVKLVVLNMKNINIDKFFSKLTIRFDAFLFLIEKRITATSVDTLKSILKKYTTDLYRVIYFNNKNSKITTEDIFKYFTDNNVPLNSSHVLEHPESKLICISDNIQQLIPRITCPEYKSLGNLKICINHWRDDTENLFVSLKTNNSYAVFSKTQKYYFYLEHVKRNIYRFVNGESYLAVGFMGIYKKSSDLKDQYQQWNITNPWGNSIELNTPLIIENRGWRGNYLSYVKGNIICNKERQHWYFTDINSDTISTKSIDDEVH